MHTWGDVVEKYSKWFLNIFHTSLGFELDTYVVESDRFTNSAVSLLNNIFISVVSRPAEPSLFKKNQFLR